MAVITPTSRSSSTTRARPRCCAARVSKIRGRRGGRPDPYDIGPHHVLDLGRTGPPRHCRSRPRCPAADPAPPPRPGRGPAWGAGTSPRPRWCWARPTPACRRRCATPSPRATTPATTPVGMSWGMMATPPRRATVSAIRRPETAGHVRHDQRQGGADPVGRGQVHVEPRRQRGPPGHHEHVGVGQGRSRAGVAEISRCHCRRSVPLSPIRPQGTGCFPPPPRRPSRDGNEAVAAVQGEGGYRSRSQRVRLVSTDRSACRHPTAGSQVTRG